MFKGARCICNIDFDFGFGRGNVGRTLALLEQVWMGVHFLLDEVMVPVENLVSLFLLFLFILYFLFGENGKHFLQFPLFSGLHFLLHRTKERKS